MSAAADLSSEERRRTVRKSSFFLPSFSPVGQQERKKKVTKSNRKKNQSCCFRLLQYLQRIFRKAMHRGGIFGIWETGFDVGGISSFPSPSCSPSRKRDPKSGTESGGARSGEKEGEKRRAKKKTRKGKTHLGKEGGFLDCTSHTWLKGRRVFFCPLLLSFPPT